MDIAWPLQPMLAGLSRRLPEGSGYLYEPKWDGFRCLVRRDGDDVDMRSRNLRPFTRYFPELADAFRGLRVGQVVLDGEIVICADDRFDFSALMARLHPAASRVERLSRETPASFVAFDLLLVDGVSRMAEPFELRRAALEELLLETDPPLFVTPVTDDLEHAQIWLERFTGNGVDGVVAKPRDLPYQSNKRALIKIKPERTAECVVAGMRAYGETPLVGSLLLGLYDDAGVLRHVGVASSFTDERQAELFFELRDLIVALEGHPWARGFGLQTSLLGRLGGTAARWGPSEDVHWTPLDPRLVCEVTYDQWEGDRFRHPARFKRWRPDRDAASCTFEQLDVSTARLGDILGAA